MIDATAGIASALTEVQQRKDLIASVGTDKTEGANNAFSQIFDQMVNLVGETDSLATEAEKAQINFSLGNAESTHEVTIAQQKALVSLQYTVAVKNALLEAYREIMNIQI